MQEKARPGQYEILGTIQISAITPNIPKISFRWSTKHAHLSGETSLRAAKCTNFKTFLPSEFPYASAVTKQPVNGTYQHKQVHIFGHEDKNGEHFIVDSNDQTGSEWNCYT